jgi:hypothetical protein
MTYMEICEGKEFMKTKPFQKELGGTTACAVHMAQGTCQTSIDGFVEVVKCASWFRSVKSVVEIREKCVEEKEAIFQVKTAHALFPMKFIEEILKKNRWNFN